MRPPNIDAAESGLRSIPTNPHLATSTHQLLETFYVPALSKSVSYDRGVGYFTSGWLRLAAIGLTAFAKNRGKARILASPKLDRHDVAALHAGGDARNDPVLLKTLQLELDELAKSLESDTLAALSWMIADDLLDFRIAIPVGELDGDFHDKFGIFEDAAGDSIAFHGSPNDSERAFRNYESISIYYSWLDEREAARVRGHKLRFEQIWNNQDSNLRTYALPEAIRRNLIEYAAQSCRPYRDPGPAEDQRWIHQREAIAIFLRERAGVLEMATGTGKTRTALQIFAELRERDVVRSLVVAAYGTDLLDQWHKELVRRSPLPVYRAYGTHREAQSFLNAPNDAILLTSRQTLVDVLPRLRPGTCQKAMLICDEVHGLGSPALVEALSGRLGVFPYRLGLSATPERAYDPEGTAFIEKEIGPVLFRFGLKEAIQRGILCEFDYVELGYELSDDDKQAIRQVFRRHHARTRSGQASDMESLYRDIARIRKVSAQKIQPFREHVLSHPELLKRCIIFVETAEYGALIQPILMELQIDFHTYYQDDDRTHLQMFASGGLECLLTCHRISEGIDIQTVNNIVLFASARARLETVQRLGRCLRTDPANEDKRATVVDFIQPRADDIDDPSGELSADEERSVWFRELASVKRQSVTAAAVLRTPVPGILNYEN